MPLAQPDVQEGSGPWSRISIRNESPGETVKKVPGRWTGQGMGGQQPPLGVGAAPRFVGMFLQCERQTEHLGKVQSSFLSKACLGHRGIEQ